MKNLLFIFFAIILFACKSDKTSTNVTGIDFDENLPPDFLKFHMRFHQDSVFQIEHIAFPLPGIPNMAYDLSQDSIANFHWTPEEWIMHKPFNYSEDYSRKYITYSQNLIGELIFETQSGFGIERRFSKTKSGWKLIYYVGMNEVQ